MTALTLDLLKNWIRVRHTEEDVILGTMLGAAVKHIEGQTGHLFTRRIATQRLFDSGRLLFGPNPGPVTITWTDGEGDHSEPATIVAGEVSGPWAAGAVASYEAGYETPDDVPEDLLVAALLLAGNWDANREATTQANVALSFGVEALIGNYRPVLV